MKLMDVVIVKDVVSVIVEGKCVTIEKGTESSWNCEKGSGKRVYGVIIDITDEYVSVATRTGLFFLKTDFSELELVDGLEDLINA